MDNIVTTVGDNVSLSGKGVIELGGDGELKAPDNIIMTPTAARAYYNNFRTTHVPRIKQYAAIEGVIAGNSPYNPQLLAKAGLSHIANVNTLDAKGMYERAALTFWNLANQTESLVRFTIRPFQFKGDHEFDEWAIILGRNWTKVIRERWEDFSTEMDLLTGQLVKFGLSPVVWADERNYRWKSVDVSRFFVADMTPVRVSEWSTICFETPYTLQFLYSVYENLKETGNNPWNKEALETFIVRRANQAYRTSGSTSAGFSNYLDFQIALQNGNLNHGNVFCDSVPLVNLLQKEYSGKISNYIFDPMGDSGEDFLFKVPEQYMEFSEVLTLFTYSPGELYIHGNRGVGHKIYPVSQALMQLDCHMLDMAKMSATPIVKSAVGVGKDIAPIRFISGVATDIGGAEFMQNNLGANLPGVVSVAQYMEQKVNKNAIIGGDDPGVPDPDRGSKSAPEVTIQQVKEFGVGKQNVAHFYKTFDRVIHSQTAKMLHCKEGHPQYDDVKEWKELCMEEGVPEEVFALKGAKRGQLPRHLSVRASRAAGDGSNLGLTMGLNRVGTIAGGFGAKGQYNYRKDIVSSSMGSDYVDRYLADSEEPDEALGGASLATVENFMIRQGEMPQATKDNQQKTHIASHMALITNIIQQVQSQKMDPIEADRILSFALPHNEQHIGFVAQDPLNQTFMEQITPAWKMVNKFAQVNRLKAQKMQQAELRRRQQEQDQMSADMMEQDRKDKVSLIEQNRKDRESQAKLERSKEQSQARAEIMKESTHAKADNQRLDIQLKNENKKEEIIRKPQEILAGKSSEEIQNNLEGQVGVTPNPLDYK